MRSRPPAKREASARRTRREAGAHGEDGNAIVELAILGLAVFGILVHTVVLFGSLHRATLATSAAAREVGRAVVLADGVDDANRRAARAVAVAERNHGLPAGSLTVDVNGARVRNGTLRITVRTRVDVARIPFLGSVWSGATVPVEATHTARIDRYRSKP